MKLLIITNLFPNRKEPNKAVFNVQQFKELSKHCSLKIISPVPYFKFRKKDVSLNEVIEGFDVHFPRYFVIPKIMRSLYGLFFYWGIRKEVLRTQKHFDFDAILVTWAYPDAYGVSKLAKELYKPYFVKVHGTDINVLANKPIRKGLIKKALTGANQVISVSKPLFDAVENLGVQEHRITLLPNGVNTEIFQPLSNKKEIRKVFGIPEDKKVILYVGNLEHIKGVDILAKAFGQLSKNHHLVIIGKGSLEPTLRETFRSLGIEDRVQFAGQVPHEQIPQWINAADVFCLPSRNEGCPNVLLESLACHVPVVASEVGGVPDIIDSTDKGTMVKPEDPKALANGIKNTLKRFAQKKFQAKFAPMNWEENGQRLFNLMNNS